MSDDTLLGITRTLASAVAPLGPALRDPVAFRRLMWRIGWDAPVLPPQYTTVADAVDAVVAAVEDLEDGANLLEVLASVEAIGDLYRTLQDLPSVPQGVDAAEFSANAARRLAEYVLSEYLLRHRPGTYRLLELLGVIAVERMPAGPGRAGVLRTRFDWEAIPDRLAHPDRVPGEVFGWAGEGFDHAELQRILLGAVFGLGLSGTLDAIGADYSDAVQAGAQDPPVAPIRDGITIHVAEVRVDDEPYLVGIALTDLPAEGSLLPGILLRPILPPTPDPVPLRAGWTLELPPGTDTSQDLAVLVRPGHVEARYPFADNDFPQTGFSVTLRFTPDRPVGAFGAAGTSRLELGGFEAGLHVDPDDGSGLGLRVTASVDPLALVLTTGGTDSFLGGLFGGSAARVEVPLALTWSSRTGLDVAGGLGIEVHLPAELDLGWVLIEGIDLGLELTAGASPALLGYVAATFSGAIGPVLFTVERLGAELTAAFADGNAGPVDLRFGVRWPTGVGLGVDAEGVVSGGGFLSIDRDIGRYAGVAELSMLGIGLTAVGIVETQLPGEESGWSFFLSVMADFTPIPLPFGFTLNGVGGFMGLHRTMDPDALALGVRQGRIDSLLFPTDPLAEASRIIADIAEFFPSTNGQHTFGAMVKIGWGPASLLTAEVGIVLSLPDVLIAVVGELSVTLPVPQAPLLELHMGVVGVLDVAAATLSITASIYDSQIVGIPLSGDMVTYVSLGAQPFFLLSVGGFADGWTPPAALPSSMRDLRRMAASLDLGEVFDIGIDCYFALTPNTLQFGAGVHAALSFREIGVDFTAEGSFSFDVQFTFHPFALTTRMSASVVVRIGNEPLLDLSVTLRLEGPKPWYATGTGTFRFLGQDVNINLTVGSPPAGEPDPTLDLWPLLRDALSAEDAWSTPTLTAAPGEVSLRALDPVAEEGLWLAPQAAVQVRQSVLPLNRRIEVYGSSAPQGEDRFDVEDAGLDVGTPTPFTLLREWFAPAQYTDLSPNERLAAPSFEEMDAGLALTPSGWTVPLAEDDLACVVAGHEEAVLEPDTPATWVAVGDLRGLAAGNWTDRPAIRGTSPGGRYAVSFSASPLRVDSTRYTLARPLDASPSPAVRNIPARRAAGGWAFADAAAGRRDAGGAKVRVVPTSATSTGRLP